MRKFGLIALLPLAACSSSFGDALSGAEARSSGTGNARTYAVADFSKVELRGSDNVEIRTGAAFAVRAVGRSAELDRIRIVKDGATLQVGRVDDHGAFHWSRGGEGVTIYVTMPRIERAAVTGSGDMRIDRVVGTRFAGHDAGSGSLSIAALDVESGAFTLAGSGDMSLQGRSQQVDFDIAGSGTVEAGGLRAAQARVSIAGSGGVKADVAGPASVSITGAGDVDLGPNARCTTSKMGSGSVRCGG